MCSQEAIWPKVETISHKSWLWCLWQIPLLGWICVTFKLPFQYFLCEACSSCVVDLVVRDDNMWLKRKLSWWHWWPTCEPRSAPCIPSLQVVVTLNVQSPRLTPRWHTSCKVHERESSKKKKKMGAKKLERICFSSFLLFLLLAKLGEYL